MTSSIGRQVLVHANPRHVQSAVRDEGVVLSLESGEYFALNPVGLRVWALLQTQRSFADLVATIVAEYEVTEESAEQDLSALVEALERHGLVELQYGS